MREPGGSLTATPIRERPTMDLDPIKGIALGAAIGSWIWAGIAFLVCLVFV